MARAGAQDRGKDLNGVIGDGFGRQGLGIVAIADVSTSTSTTAFGAVWGWRVTIPSKLRVTDGVCLLCACRYLVIPSSGKGCCAWRQGMLSYVYSGPH